MIFEYLSPDPPSCGEKITFHQYYSGQDFMMGGGGGQFTGASDLVTIISYIHT